MENMKPEIITEIAPVQEKHGYYVVDRRKAAFDYPVHRHDAYEVNFLYGCKGARRIVGDSITELGDLDLVLVGKGIYHGWEQFKCTSRNMREITLQVSPGFFQEKFLYDNGMDTVGQMLNLSANGIAFGIEAILKSFGTLDRLAHTSERFEGMMLVVRLFKELSDNVDFTILSTSTFTDLCETSDSRRITKVQNYIKDNITDKIRLNDLSALIGMTESSFSRFFKLRTGTSVSDYIINLRIGAAARKLVHTQMTVSEICYECGFNNVSHFCRCFRLKKSCSPSEFRRMYHKAIVDR